MPFRCFQAFVLFRHSFVKVVDPVDAAAIEQHKIQMIKVKVFNERNTWFEKVKLFMQYVVVSPAKYWYVNYCFATILIMNFTHANLMVHIYVM